MDSLHNDYLYQLETMAPKPKSRTCRHLIMSRPKHFGAEFHGRISREHTALLLRCDGEYLVRESVNELGQYCLSMKINGAMKNYKLYYDGTYYSVGDKKFQKLVDLVEDGIIHMFIEHEAKHYIENMSKSSIYAQLKASKYDEIDARIPAVASPYAEIPLDHHYMTSSSSGKSSVGQFSDRVYEAIVDECLTSLNLNQPNTTSSLASKSSLSNMSTGQSSDCLSSDSYQSPLASPTPTVCPVPKKKKGIMTSLKRSLSFSQKRKSRPTRITRAAPAVVMEPYPDYEKVHDFKVATYKGKRYCGYCGNYLWGLIEQGVQCADCGIDSHRGCSRLIPHDCSPSPKLVKRIFGTSLVTLVKLYSTHQPIIVNICVQEIERRDVLKLKGIYRENGDSVDIELLKEQIDLDIGSVNLTAVDAYTIASLLKLYLRMLPEPLVEVELYPRFLNAINQQHRDYGMAVTMIQKALNLLHPAHYATLKYIIEHLERVVRNKEHNKMTVENVGICFGPVIFRSSNLSTKNFSKGVEEAQNQKELVAFLITNRKKLFH